MALCLSFPDYVLGQGQIKRQNHSPINNSNSSKRTNNIQDLSAKFNWDTFGICQDTIVDWGLSVKWAGWNIWCIFSRAGRYTFWMGGGEEGSNRKRNISI